MRDPLDKYGRPHMRLFHKMSNLRSRPNVVSQLDDQSFEGDFDAYSSSLDGLSDAELEEEILRRTVFAKVR
ncbi:MAG TPA: hypothetical protein V6C57_27375 [Coleofasciculaceae cyanobacterium]